MSIDVTEDTRTHESARPALDKPVRIAIIGCGAVTEKKLVPALARSTRVGVTALVDVNEARLRRLGESAAVENLFTEVSDAAPYADIAVIAVPHHLHAPVAVKAMEAGIDVFVEKPLATSMRDVHAMLSASVTFGRKIGVGLVRRQYASYKYVKEVLDVGLLGSVRSFDFREGAVYNWPVATLATFKKDTAGGVLFDTGAHTLDMLLSWLGDFRDVRYSDDSRGGVEANCRLELTLRSGVTGTIELSRTRNLRNTCIIRCERGEIEVGVGTRGPVTLRIGATEMTAEPSMTGQSQLTPLDFTRLQVEEFAEAIAHRRDCALFAENTLPSIRLFDASKARPQALELPWEAYRGEPDLPDLSGRTVLVIGGTGFIGGRLVEILARHTSARVRVLFRDPARLANVSRFDVETVPGDVSDARTVAAALEGCDIVFNCSFGRGSRDVARRVNVDAVGTLVREAASARVARLVHLSTVASYGVPPDGELREEHAYRADRSYVYGFTKWQGERVGLDLARELGIDVVVLQPTIVYGPGAPSWTLNPLRLLKSGRVALIGGGDGLCNAVYVDDVVQAMVRAATAETGAGERFLISGSEPVRWREFYRAYEDMLGHSSTVHLSLEELEDLRKQQAKRAATLAQLSALVRDPDVYRRLARLPIVERAKSLLPRPAIVAAKRTVYGTPGQTAAVAPGTPAPVHVSTALDALLQSRRTRVSIEKSQRVLGYQPLYNFADGMWLTSRWAEWANLLS